MVHRSAAALERFRRTCRRPFGAHPRLSLGEERAHLGEHGLRVGTLALERLDPGESSQHGARFFHLSLDASAEDPTWAARKCDDSRRMERFAQVVVALGGALYTATAAALLFAPRWFFENVGEFPPYNRHYEGDAGAFLAAIGLALLVAARRPAQHIGLVAVGAVASVVHAVNHGYDWARGDESLASLLALAGYAVAITVVLATLRRTPR